MTEKMTEKLPLQSGKMVLFRTYFILKSFNDGSLLMGQYEYPCSFRLPTFLPGTFEEKKPNYKAIVKYFIKGMIVPPQAPSKSHSISSSSKKSKDH
jgi:hypothetical protein